MGKEADKFFAALLSEGDAGNYIRMGDIGALFTHVPSELDVFDYIQDFMSEYGKLPELKTFNEATGKKLKRTDETPDFYLDNLKERHVYKTMIKASREGNKYMHKNGEDYDPLKAYEIVRKYLDELSLQHSAPLIVDFKESHDMLKHELLEKKKPDYGINTGWGYFDYMNGSLRGGDLISILGRTSLGKTWLMLFIAMYVWEVHQKPVLFFSMEMDSILIMERLASMYQGIPYNTVKKGEFTTLRRDTRAEFLDNMLELSDSDLPAFNVISGNLKTNIEDIVALAHQLKPAAVFVDGAYMVKTNEGFSKYERIGNVAETLKSDIAGVLNIPVFTSWQFNREVTKLKKGQRAGTEHIGGGDVIGNVSSIVLGLFEEESSETIRQRRIEVVKGRSGESGEFLIHWNFKTMNFNQIEEIKDYEVLLS